MIWAKIPPKKSDCFPLEAKHYDRPAVIESLPPHMQGYSAPKKSAPNSKPVLRPAKQDVPSHMRGYSYGK